MEITRQTLSAARVAEYQQYLRERYPSSRFTPLSDAMPRALMSAAIDAIGEEDQAAEPQAEPVVEPDDEPPIPPREKPVVIVRTRKPRPRG